MSRYTGSCYSRKGGAIKNNERNKLRWNDSIYVNYFDPNELIIKSSEEIMMESESDSESSMESMCDTKIDNINQ
jgi:hypothetical protein